MMIRGTLSQLLHIKIPRATATMGRLRVRVKCQVVNGVTVGDEGTNGAGVRVRVGLG